MRSFSKLYSDFWINYDNSEVVSLGIDAQLMALYLQGNSHHNMLGVYYLPLLYAASDLKLPVKKVLIALQKLCKTNYCKYDEKTQYIWVCNTAFEQIGEDIDIKDNRIKAIHAIWQALPSKLEFLKEVYQKYQGAFHLEPRFFDFLDSLDSLDSLDQLDSFDSCDPFEKTLNPETCKTNEIKEIREIKDEQIIPGATVVTAIDKKDTKGIKDTNEDINIDVSTVIDANLNKDINIQPSSCSLLDSVYPFEEVSELFQSLPEVEESTYASYPARNILVPPPKLPSAYLEDFFEPVSCLDTSSFLQDPSGGINSDGNHIVLTPSKGLRSPSETPSKDLRSPFEAPQKALRSNIECRIKNIENRNKKEEIKKRDIHIDNVLNSNIVAQKEKAQPSLNEKQPGPSDKTFLFFKDSEKPETTKAAQAADIELQPLAHDSCNLPIVLPSISSEPKGVPKTIKSKNSTDGSVDSVVAVFEHWKNTMQHPKSNLDSKRKGLIHKALLLGYNVQQLCEAITGCSYTPHNIGQNDRGQRYDGLHVILRDADQIDRFIHNCHSPPKPFTEAHQRLQANLYEVNEWVSKKINESAEIKENKRSNYA